MSFSLSSRAPAYTLPNCGFRAGMYFSLLLSGFSMQAITAQQGAFNPQLADAEIVALAEQPDGRILVGGNFDHFAGVARSGLARVNANGSLDPSFNPSANSDVSCFAVQNDGKIIVGGRFSSIAGQSRIAIARLNRNGTLDSTFTANADNRVTCLAIQRDGKIIMAGSFMQVAGNVRNRIARLLPTGQLDTTFNPNVDGDINSMTLDGSGKILISGDFSTVGGVFRKYLARLGPNGALDNTFQPVEQGAVGAVSARPTGGLVTDFNTSGTSGLVRLLRNGALDTSFNAPANYVDNSICRQADGKTIVGGTFYVGGGDYNPLDRHLGRFNPNGSLDSVFTGPLNAIVWATMIRSDGSVLIGDRPSKDVFSFRLTLVANSAPTQSITVIGGNQVRWMRGGSLPDLEAAFFQTSTDGITWKLLGNAVPIAGGWELNGATPSPSAKIRARGRVRGGEGNGSVGLIQFIKPTSAVSEAFGY